MISDCGVARRLIPDTLADRIGAVIRKNTACLADVTVEIIPTLSHSRIHGCVAPDSSSCIFIEINIVLKIFIIDIFIVDLFDSVFINNVFVSFVFNYFF